jgi:hypothetical protein
MPALRSECRLGVILEHHIEEILAPMVASTPVRRLASGLRSIRSHALQASALPPPINRREPGEF